MKIIQISLLLLLLPLAVVTAAQQDLQCHVNGQCQGIVVDFSTIDSYNICLDKCKGNTNCNWITHYGDTSLCEEFYDCSLVDDSSCTNCFSGQGECEPQEPVCNIPGICNGHHVALNRTQDVESCLEFCQLTEGCNWYSYRLDSKECLLTEDCLILDDTCTNCLAGERECKLGNTGGEIIGNKIFVTSGDGANFKVEVIDLLAKQQQSKSCANLADFPGGTHGVIGTFIENSTTIVCGGSSSPSSSCYNYHPDSDRWVITFPMLEKRRYPAAVLVSPTKWWVTGGWDGVGSSYTTEMFKSEQGFSPYVDMPTPMNGHNLVKVNETHYMVLGGSPATHWAWMFNMETESWEQLPNLLVPTSFTHAGLVTHSNGSADIVVAAGQNINVTQIFSLASQTWRIGMEFPSGNLEQGASVPYGNTFLLVGGNVGNTATGYQDKIFKYVIDSGEWEELPQKLDFARDTTAAFLVPDDYITCDALN